MLREALSRRFPSARAVVERHLTDAGISIGGSALEDIAVLDDRFYTRVLAEGTLGLGEAYMDGWWQCPYVDRFIAKLLLAGQDGGARFSWRDAPAALRARVASRQGLSRSRRNVAAHYDIGNDLYAAMLGPSMTYSCAYWNDASTLDRAQEAKHDLVCRKIGLHHRKGQRVLDIGCGWGSFAVFAAERYGARVTGLTLSENQAAWALNHYESLPVDIRLQDYREMTADEPFDHVVSIGMFEHIGPRNYRTFMRIVHRLLKPEGLFLLHTIGGLTPTFRIDRWIDRYIFPGAVLPTLGAIMQAAEGAFVVEDVHNFGPDYEKTLTVWHRNFQKARPGLGAAYDERFCRMWEYYLLSCAGTFRARTNQLYQLVLSPRGVPGGYRTIR